MDLRLKIVLVIFSILLAIIITIFLKKGRIPIKYSLLWYASSCVIFFVAAFPFIIDGLTKLFGFKMPVNLVIGILFAILLFLTMSLTIITSGQNKKITLLIQEVSMLKSKDNNK